MKQIEMILSLILLLSFLTLLTPCNGQNSSQRGNKYPSVTVCDTVSELSKKVWIVFQASNGHYWFGSGSGIYRWDGNIIVKFMEYNGSTNTIRGIQEDRQGNIYFSTTDAIRKFDGHSFSTLTAIKSNSSIDNWKLQPEDLWFTILGKGVFRYDGKNLYQLKFPKHFLEEEYYKNNPTKPWNEDSDEVFTIYKDSKGNIWFGTLAVGVCRYDGKTLSWLYEKHLTESATGIPIGIRAIFEDKDGKFWFHNYQYRYHIYPNDTTKKENNLINYKREKGIDLLKTSAEDDSLYDRWPYFTAIVEDKNHDLWISTSGNGVWRYDPSDELSADHKSITHYSADMPCYIFKDNNGDVWLGKFLEGALKFNGVEFEKFKP